jgi:hypothetical protein
MFYDSLSGEVLSILKPLLNEINIYNEVLDKEEFIQSGLALYQSLSIVDKAKIMNF